MIDLKNIAVFGALGALGMMWSHVQQIFARISSFLIVSVELNGGTEDSFMDYAWNNMKYSRFGERRYTQLEKFIRSRDRQGLVAYEMIGKSVTFFKGWRPIFLSVQVDKNSGNPMSGAKISFIRGTFNIDKLLTTCVNTKDELNHSTTKNKNRYYVKKCFGRRISKSQSPGEPTEMADKGSLVGHSNDNGGARPINVERLDIGAPVSAIPFRNLAYDQHVKNFQIDIRRWKESEKWYKSKGLNWRMGAGILGPPGTGKTSFVRATGQELDMPIHIYDLTTMDNEELCQFWGQSLSAAPCIVLFEDIDRIFDKDKNIKSTKDKSVTLDCLLNCIGGVEPANGILVFVTANDPTKLDPALGAPDKSGKSSRPGRLDRTVFFGPLSAEGRYEIAKRILSDCTQFIESAVKDGEGETGAQFEARCSAIALEAYWGKPKVYVEETFDISKMTIADEDSIDFQRRKEAEEV